MAVGGTTPYDFDIRPSQNSNMISTNMSLTNKKLIVGGGLKNNYDLEQLRKIKSDNLEGVIAGKSFYVGNIDLKESQKILDGNA